MGAIVRKRFSSAIVYYNTRKIHCKCIVQINCVVVYVRRVYFTVTLSIVSYSPKSFHLLASFISQIKFFLFNCFYAIRRESSSQHIFCVPCRVYRFLMFYCGSISHTFFHTEQFNVQVHNLYSITTQFNN